MLFVTYKESISSALDRVSKVVKFNPRSAEILQCIRLDTNSGGVYITASSPMANVRVKVEGAKSDSNDSVVVNFDKFKDRISKTDSVVKVEASNGKMSIVSNENQMLGLALNDIREFPKISWDFPEESYGVELDEFLDIIGYAANITSDVTALTPAFLQVKIKDQTVYSASGVMYHKFPLECNPELSTTIPTQTLKALHGFIKSSAGSVVWMSQQVNDSDIVVSVGDDQFQTVPLALPFPNIDSMFDKIKIMATEELSFSSSKELIGVLNKARTSVDKFGTVNLKINGSAMTSVTVSASNESGDWFEHSINVLWTGKADGRSLRFNLDSLINFVKAINSEELTLRFGEDFRGDLSPAYCEIGEQVGILNQFRV